MDTNIDSEPLFTHTPLGYFARQLIAGVMDREANQDLIAAIRENPDVDCANDDEREIKRRILEALPPGIREQLHENRGLCMWFSPRLATCIAFGNVVSYAAKPDVVFEPGTDIEEIVAYICMVM